MFKSEEFWARTAMLTTGMALGALLIRLQQYWTGPCG